MCMNLPAKLRYVPRLVFYMRRPTQNTRTNTVFIVMILLLPSMNDVVKISFLRISTVIEVETPCTYYLFLGSVRVLDTFSYRLFVNWCRSNHTGPLYPVVWNDSIIRTVLDVRKLWCVSNVGCKDIICSRL